MMKVEEKQSVRVNISNLFCYSCSAHLSNLDNFKSHQCSNVSKSTSRAKKSSLSPKNAKKKSESKPKFYGRVKGGNGKSVVVKSRPVVNVNVKELQDYMHCCRCYTTFYKLLDLIKHFKDCQVQKQTNDTFQEYKTQKKKDDESSIKIVSISSGSTTAILNNLEQHKNNVESNASEVNINTNTNDECLKSQKGGETKSSLETIQIQSHENFLDSPNSPFSPLSPIHQDSETESTHDNNIDIDVPSPSSSVPCLPEIKEEEENSEIKREAEDCTNNNNTNNNSVKRKRVSKSRYKRKPPTYPVADPSNVEFPFLTCSTCCRIFKHPHDRKLHELTHGQKTIKCTKCTYSCRTRPGLYFHMKQKHPGVDPYRCYKYPACLMTFATPEELKSHRNTHRPKRYYCPEPGCTRSYSAHALILDHLNSHKNLRPHICEKCAAPFETLAQLKTHLISHRTPTYKCNFEGCSKLFKSTTYLKSHQATHSVEKSYKCTESGCNASYSQEKRLKSHIKVMHKKEEEILCTLCGRSFLRKGTFKRHLLSHAQEKNIHCNFEGCSFSCVDKHGLTRHMKTHTGERAHVCSFDSCDKKFSSSSTRKRHEQTHTQAKPFVCAFCPQAFHDNRMLKKHVLSYHEEEEFDITVPLSYRAKEST